jgi:TrpR-related protein YerC/YecD
MQKNDFADLLFDAILTLETREECYEFFSDACTPKEVQAIAQRFAVAKMLNEKKVYNDIIEHEDMIAIDASNLNIYP